jgi:hypothetical protein
MRRNEKALKKTAFHEAGHAVEAFMLDVPFRSVTIRPDWLMKRTQISLAGQIAEALHAGRRPARYSHAADDDNAVNRAVAMCSSTDECSAWINWLFIRTRNRLSLRHIWHAVEVLAASLIERETLDSKTACSIIRSSFSGFTKKSV